MVKSLKYFLSILILCSLVSCKKSISPEEKIKKSNEMINGDDTSILGPHFQGSVRMMTYTEEAIALNPKNADAWRELSIPYLKRGMPHKWKPLFEKAVLHDSIGWQPWRGYLYLWFYRDYKKAIADFDASDVLTPNFIDAPQGHSVDYWRGIAYLGLKDYKNSIYYFDKYIAKETKDTGEDWVEMTGFLYLGIAHYENQNDSLALLNINKLLKYTNDDYADGNYYKALILEKQNRNQEALKLVDLAITNYKEGYYNNRPYVETLRQIYMEDLLLLKERLTKK